MASTPRPAKIVIGGILLCVPVLFAVLAVPRFLRGLSAEPFHRVIDAAELGERLPASTDRAAADALADAAPDDGQSLAEHALTLVLSADRDPAALARARTLVVDSLRAAPSNPNAWLLLCQIDAHSDPDTANACLANALRVSAYDWYTTGARMRLVAEQWPYLDERVRDKAVSLIMPMWTAVDPFGRSLHGALYQLSFTANGRQLLRAGFAGHRDDLRDFNHYIFLENVYGP